MYSKYYYLCRLCIKYFCFSKLIMEISVIPARTYSSSLVSLKTNVSIFKIKYKSKPKMPVELNRTMVKINATKTNYTYLENIVTWNTSDFYYNVSNSSDLDYDYQMMNGKFLFSKPLYGFVLF